MHVAGEGTPVVVFEAGIGATSLSWVLVQPAIAKLTTTVAYDRAGLGWSGPSLTRRTPSVIAGELRGALQQAGLSAPFILCGHSFGGLVIQRFATLYKDDVSGIVLVDALRASDWAPMSAEQQIRLEQGIRLSRRGATLARLGIVGASLRMLLAGNRIMPRLAARLSAGSGGSGFTDRLAGELRKLPRELWPVIAWHWSQAKNFEGMAQHLECLPASVQEMGSLEKDHSCAVTALIAGKSDPEGLPPTWKVIQAPGSGHWLQLDRPELVISAIEELIAAQGKVGC